MSVRIMAKKAFEFVEDGTPDKARCVKVEPYIIATVPDWVITSDLFRLAQRSGNAEVMGNTTNDISIADIEALQERAKELGIKNYKNMKLETLRQRIAEAEAANGGKKAANNADKDDLSLDDMDLANLKACAEKNNIDITGLETEDEIRIRIKESALKD